jgi:hypothetical protein
MPFWSTILVAVGNEQLKLVSYWDNCRTPQAKLTEACDAANCNTGDLQAHLKYVTTNFSLLSAIVKADVIPNGRCKQTK